MKAPELQNGWKHTAALTAASCLRQTATAESDKHINPRVQYALA
jgi:hypothetical protein